MTDVISSNYPANSHKARVGDTADTTDRKKVDKVINGDAVKRKKGLGRKMAETFTGDDVQSVGTYILFDVVMPAAKTMISDAVSQGIERMLFGDGARRSTSKSSVGHTSYNRMYSGSSRDNRSSERTMSPRARATHDFDEVILETRGEAEEVLDLLVDLLGKYDVVTVSDLYDAVGVSGSYTDDKWGWTNLKGAAIRRIRAGYLIDLPRPESID